MRYAPTSPSIGAFKGIRETDIQDYYLPSPLTPQATATAQPRLTTPAVPLPKYRLTRRGG